MRNLVLNNRLILHLIIQTKYNRFHYPVGQIWLASIFMEVVMEYVYIRVSSRIKILTGGGHNCSRAKGSEIRAEKLN